VRAAGWLILAAVAGCEYSPEIRPGVIACEVDGPPCPRPYTCVVQFEPGRGLCDLPHAVADAGTEPPPDAREPGRPDVRVMGSEEAGTVAPDAAPPDAPGAPDAPAADVPVPPDTSLPPPDVAPAVDVPPDAALVCPHGRGPDMVKIGGAVSFCIDSTEVTNRQYKVFLDDPGADLFLQPEVCRGMNDGYAPTSSDGGGLNVTTRAEHPVVNVDWCDAYAFCKWAGKRLCGSIAGGPLVAGAAAVPTISQWAHACTGGGTYSYPYGLSFNPAACNINRPEFPVNTVPVQTKLGCVGGFKGIYDMVGNVEEWVDFCRMDPLEGWVCGVIGGPYTAKNSTEAQCSEFYDDPMIDHWVARGFRCCAP
jgi:sulfatase modifying factor 1